jgi:hypothetical protein
MRCRTSARLWIIARDTRGLKFDFGSCPPAAASGGGVGQRNKPPAVRGGHSDREKRRSEPVTCCAGARPSDPRLIVEKRRHSAILPKWRRGKRELFPRDAADETA